MMRRVWVLAVGLGVFPGCFHHGSDVVSPGRLAELTARGHEPEPQQAGSPYDARAAAPAHNDTGPVVGSPATVDPVPLRPAEPKPGDFHPLADVPPGPPAPSDADQHKAVQASLTVRMPEDSLVSAFACFRENRLEEAREKLKVFDPAAREMLALVLPLAISTADLKTADYPALLDRFENAISTMRARLPLSLEKVCFCRSIDRFGVYDPLPGDHVFQAGGEGRPGELVRLYVEVENFRSLRGEAGYETALGCTMVLRKGKELVWRQDRPVESERSRSPRRDCYLGCYFYVPPRLPVGDYTLTVQVTDLTGTKGEQAVRRSASRSLDFRVGSQNQ